MIHLHTKIHFGFALYREMQAILCFLKSCFFDVPLDHKVYTSACPYHEYKITCWKC